jgi:hypothetical protein
MSKAYLTPEEHGQAWVDACKSAGFGAPTVVPAGALAMQEGGGHYKDMKVQPIEYITANNLGYCEANIVKYASRHEHKGGPEDIRKIKHYCDLILQLQYGES